MFSSLVVLIHGTPLEERMPLGSFFVEILEPGGCQTIKTEGGVQESAQRDSSLLIPSLASLVSNTRQSFLVPFERKHPIF